jgi:hypothetical protein
MRARRIGPRGAIFKAGGRSSVTMREGRDIRHLDRDLMAKARELLEQDLDVLEA